MREKEDFDKTLNKQDASLKTILEKAKKLFLDLKAFPISRDKFLGKLNTHFQIEDKNEQTKLYNLINKIFDDTSLSKINLKDLVKEFNTKEDNPKEVEMLDKKHDIIDGLLSGKDSDWREIIQKHFLRILNFGKIVKNTVKILLWIAKEICLVKKKQTLEYINI